MEYKRIKEITIKNFLAIKERTISFEKSPIIVLSGDNESGKSSTLQPLSVVGYNANSKEQKDFIRNGTRGFGIEIELEDGTKVSRVKSDKKNGYYIEYGDGRAEWGVDRLDAGSGAPTYVEEVMGMIKEKETGEYLHVRTHDDKLLFARTSAGTNYKVLYDSLKVDNILKAIRLGNKEISELRSETDRCESIIQHNKEEISNIVLEDMEPLKNIAERLKLKVKRIKLLAEANDKLLVLREKERILSNYNLKELELIDEKLLTNLEKIIEFKEKVIKLSNLKLVDNLETIKEDKIESIIEMLNLKAKYIELEKFRSNLSEIEKVNKVDISTVDKIYSLIKMKKRLEAYEKEYLNLKELSLVDINVIKGLLELKKKIKELSEKSEERKEIDKKVSVFREIIRKSGAKILECDNCGHDVVILDS